MLALDPDTGKLKWHYQFTPHDLHDWDATQNPVLVETEFLGQMRKVLAWPNRNGFFYLIDRTNGKFMSAKAFVKQTWNDGFDYENNGTAEASCRATTDPEGNDGVWPGIDGGANWMSHSYSPLTKLSVRLRARGAAGVHQECDFSIPTTDETRRRAHGGRCCSAVAAAAAASVRSGRKLGQGGRDRSGNRRDEMGASA